VRNKDQTGSLFLLGILQGVFLESSDADNTKRPDMGSAKNPTRPKRQIKLWNRRQAARSIANNQSRKRGRYRRLAATDATNDKGDACGTKLHERVQTNTSGEPAYSFPSGSRSIHQHGPNLASAFVSSARGVASRQLVR